MISIILLALATWRVSSLIANDEDGPFEIFARFRYFAGVRYNEESEPYGTTNFSKGLICIWCVSLWFALVFSFFDPKSVNVHTYVVNWLAISAGAILFDEVLDRIRR